MLEVLLAKEAIRDLLARYCLYIDLYKFREFAELFVEDGEWTAAFAQARGVEPIARLMTELVPTTGPGSRRKHYITNILIEVSGSAAAATMIFLVVRDSHAGMVLALAGTYECAIIQTDAGWRFRRVNVVSDIAGDLALKK
jgi:3-phenylpropionate/cinnamic acid dioxygenase small subunit